MQNTGRDTDLQQRRGTTSFDREVLTLGKIMTHPPAMQRNCPTHADEDTTSTSNKRACHCRRCCCKRRTWCLLRTTIATGSCICSQSKLIQKRKQKQQKTIALSGHDSHVQWKAWKNKTHNPACEDRDFPVSHEHVHMKVSVQHMTANTEKAQLTAENVAEFEITVTI